MVSPTSSSNGPGSVPLDPSMISFEPVENQPTQPAAVSIGFQANLDPPHAQQGVVASIKKTWERFKKNLENFDPIKSIVKFNVKAGVYFAFIKATKGMGTHQKNYVKEKMKEHINKRIEEEFKVYKSQKSQKKIPFDDQNTPARIEKGLIDETKKQIRTSVSEYKKKGTFQSAKPVKPAAAAAAESRFARFSAVTPDAAAEPAEPAAGAGAGASAAGAGAEAETPPAGDQAAAAAATAAAAAESRFARLSDVTREAAAPPAAAESRFARLSDVTREAAAPPAAAASEYGKLSDVKKALNAAAAGYDKFSDVAAAAAAAAAPPDLSEHIVSLPGTEEEPSKQPNTTAQLLPRTSQEAEKPTRDQTQAKKQQPLTARIKEAAQNGLRRIRNFGKRLTERALSEETNLPGGQQMQTPDQATVYAPIPAPPPNLPDTRSLSTSESASPAAGAASETSPYGEMPQLPARRSPLNLESEQGQQSQPSGAEAALTPPLTFSDYPEATQQRPSERIQTMTDNIVTIANTHRTNKSMELLTAEEKTKLATDLDRISRWVEENKERFQQETQYIDEKRILGLPYSLTISKDGTEVFVHLKGVYGTKKTKEDIIGKGEFSHTRLAVELKSGNVIVRKAGIITEDASTTVQVGDRKPITLEEAEREGRIGIALRGKHGVVTTRVVCKYTKGKGEAAQRKYGLMTEHMNGGSLEDAFASGRLSDEEKRIIARGVCEGLKSIAEIGYSHNDLHAGNILLQRDVEGRVIAAKVADFGQTRKKEIKFAGSAKQQNRALVHPEYFQGGEPTLEKKDDFNLGLLLYELYVGQKCPWKDAAQEAIQEATQKPPDWVKFRAMGKKQDKHLGLRDLDNATIPQEVKDVIKKLLATNPIDRKSAEAAFEFFKNLSGQSKERPSGQSEAPPPSSSNEYGDVQYGSE